MPWPPEDPDMWAVEAAFGSHSGRTNAKDPPIANTPKEGTVGLDHKEQHDAEWKETDQGRDHPQQSKIKKIPVVEVFGPTIQGEGAMAGLRTSFIRFGLCDYRCKMCDSMHAVDPIQVKANATWMTQEQIANELYLNLTAPMHEGRSNCHWVTFSGGNPCMHDLSELVLRIRGFDILIGKVKIAVETQGTLLPGWLHMCDNITVSPKGPGMGEKFEHGKFLQFVLAFGHHPGFNVKVVIFSQQDFEFAKSINNILKDEGLADKMYLSLGNPLPPGKDNLEGEPGVISTDDLRIRLLNDYKILVEDLMLEHSLDNVRFYPQIHVLTWGNKQGV
jgi:7-carboxy-7-deazaguanine synthase